ncbi:MAG TPA: hypothetical protein VNA87_00385, partial [Actinomycetota bacterium]|nr:hypothetical protein [Actinomycetota bacterium]
VGFTGGVRVAAGNVRNRTALDEIVTVPWTNGGPHARLFDSYGTELSGRFPFDIWWTGGYDVTAANGSSFVTIASTGRRASMRLGPR